MIHPLMGNHSKKILKMERNTSLFSLEVPGGQTSQSHTLHGISSFKMLSDSALSSRFVANTLLSKCANSWPSAS